MIDARMEDRREVALAQAVKWCTWDGCSADMVTTTAMMFEHYLDTGEAWPEEDERVARE